ncbi:hypothetical protein B4U80_11634 [Leptotrombidium deliense]|uniref:Ig-like domain-containing protein n=1 Tax=Leptotrombidium deliense TaxID=299467 RepID=A0A443SWX0_9ACAR|nr:hypothetical protein B4U80_11634 [Leptotrombidium deliense]
MYFIVKSGDQQLSTNITIMVRQQQNGQHLTCTAENPKITDSGLSDQLKLDIHYAPQLSLKFGSSSVSPQSVNEGNDVYFDCQIDANPSPKTAIIWRLNGIVLRQRQQGIIQSNQSLVLQTVTRTHSGTYECECSNEYGSATSNSIDLRVRFAPVCKTNAISILNYAPHASQHFGSIECIAKNEVGLQRKPCVFAIVAAGLTLDWCSTNGIEWCSLTNYSSFAAPPLFPFNCELVNQSYNTLVILCVYKTHSNARLHSSSRTQQNVYIYPRTLYVCEVYQTINSYLVANVSTSYTQRSSLSNQFDRDAKQKITLFSCYKLDVGGNHNLQFVVTDLQSATRFKLKLYAQNAKGKSGDVWLKAETSHER